MRADRPSSTATLIAAATVYLSRDPRAAVPAPAGAAALCERALEAASPLRLGLVRLVSRPGLRWLPRLAERATVPGLMRHFLARKRGIERAAREALAAGVREVVILGAGFDTLAARLAPEFPAVRFVEVDHPATQRIKKEAFQERGIRFIEADLSKAGLNEILQSGAPSLFIVEGLLMYLDDAQIAALFGAIAALQPPGSRLVFTQMEVPQFRGATPLVTGLLALWSEPFRSMLARDRAEAFLARFGYRLAGLDDPDGLGEVTWMAGR